MPVTQNTFNDLKQGCPAAEIELWTLVRRFTRRWWRALSDEVHDIAAEVFTDLCRKIRECQIQWQGEAQFAVLVQTTVNRRALDWIGRHPAPPSSDAGDEIPPSAQVPAAGQGRRPPNALEAYLRQYWAENLASDLVEALIELILAMETAPSPQERQVLRADFWVWLHENLRPHALRRAAAELLHLNPSRTYNPRSEGREKVWNALRSREARQLFNAIWPQPEAPAAD